jgi:YbbR domain-containing protein
MSKAGVLSIPVRIMVSIVNEGLDVVILPPENALSIGDRSRKRTFISVRLDAPDTYKPIKSRTFNVLTAIP